MRDGLHPTTFSQTFVTFPVFFDAFEDFLTREDGLSGVGTGAGGGGGGGVDGVFAAFERG